jgi:hypothetical protein
MQRDLIALVSNNLHELKRIWTVLVYRNCVKNYVYTDNYRQAIKMFHTTTLSSLYLSFAFIHPVSCQHPTTRWNLCLNTKFIRLNFYVRVWIFNTTLQDRTERLRLLYWACLLFRSSAGRNIYCPHGNGAKIQRIF